MTPRYLLKPARLAGSPLLATQSDDRLVDLVRAGSEPAFDAIVTRYRGRLLRYCAGVVGRERAEDAVQQTFVNAFHAIHRDENKLNLRPWLYRIAHNVSLNALRDRALGHEALDVEHPGAESPDRALERREELASVLAAVEGLPPRQRDAIVLRELEGRSYDEIAAALGVGGGAVRALLNRARNSVRMAATAVTPVGLLLRIPPGADQAGEGVAARVAELTAGAGAGALASKVAATALVTGAVAGGVAVVPDSDNSSKTSGKNAPAERPTAPKAGATGPVDGPLGADSDGDDEDRGGPGSGTDDDDGEREDDRSGPGDGDGEPDSSGPGGNSGPGEGTESLEESSGPGSGEPESSDSGSGGDSGSGSSGSESGGSGSDSGGSGSDSGTSGSGSSGSGSSGSGSGGSGSGSEDPAS